MTDTIEPPTPPPPVPPPPPPGSPVVVEAVTGAVAGLGEMLWAARAPGELLATVVALERLQSVLFAVELAVVAEVEATRAAATQGGPRRGTS